MTAPVSLLSRLHSSTGLFFMLVRKGGIVVIEGPAEQHPPRDPPETVLRLFMSLADASEYRARSGFAADTAVQKTTLVGLWALLERLTEISEEKFKCPVAVEVSALNARGEVITVDTLHSRHLLPA